MASIRQHLLATLAIAVAISPVCLPAQQALIPAGAPRFRSDDPLRSELPPRNVTTAKLRKVDDIYDFAFHSFVTPARIAAEKENGGSRPAQDINTLGEVPDGAWYTNRHWLRRLSLDELKQGPGNSTPPANGIWKVVGAKSDGVTPGFTIQDSSGQRYLLKLDPVDGPELASGADMIGSKLLYAVGYHTPENYIVYFDRNRLEVDERATFVAASGRRLRLTDGRIRRLLRYQPRDSGGRYRSLASRLLQGEPLGPSKFTGTRRDDPNDTVAHELRRSLRGYAVFASWMNHTDSRSINSLDMLVTSGDVKHVRHYLIDFGSAFGSDSLFIKEASRGNVYDIDPVYVRKQVVTLGIYSPEWMRVRQPELRGVGRFSYSAYDPQRWKPAYPNPAFLRRDANDEFWAARQVARFTDADIRAMVETAQYSDPRATEYMTRVLCERRDRIVEAYVKPVLAIDTFRMDGSRLTFEKVPGGNETAISTEWAAYDNARGTEMAWPRRSGEEMPPEALEMGAGSYCVAKLRNGRGGSVRAFIRRNDTGWEVVGVDRSETTPLAN